MKMADNGDASTGPPPLPPPQAPTPKNNGAHPGAHPPLRHPPFAGGAPPASLNGAPPNSVPPPTTTIGASPSACTATVAPPAPSPQTRMREPPTPLPNYGNYGPSAVAKHYVPKYGRFYGAFREGQYFMPVDEEEWDRLDIFHKFFTVARRGHIHNAPLVLPSDDSNPTLRSPAILDLGCGTGIWAFDMANRYQSSMVRGLDLALIQPEAIPGNVLFQQMDIESPWPDWVRETSWDMVYIRALRGSIHDWSELYSKALRSLKPGYGYIEQVELDFTPRSANNTILPDSPLARWHRDLSHAMKLTGRPLDPDPERTRERLATAGFEDIHEERIKIPMNPWMEDNHEKSVGRWCLLGIGQGLEAFTMYPYREFLRRSEEEVRDLLVEVKRDLGTLAFQPYCYLYIWTARRPATASQ